jgi:hypothetical protein
MDAIAQSEALASNASPDKMSDHQLVNYIGKRLTKFLVEIRPYLIEMQSRFVQKKAEGRPFLGYTDFDRFCIDVLSYTGRHVRRIINGDGLPKRRKRLQVARRKEQPVQRLTVNEAAVSTYHDFIRKAVQSIKALLLPLESDPPRYSKVALAIADEITGDFKPKEIINFPQPLPLHEHELPSDDIS